MINVRKKELFIASNSTKITQVVAIFRVRGKLFEEDITSYHNWKGLLESDVLTYVRELFNNFNILRKKGETKRTLVYIFIGRKAYRLLRYDI